MKSIKLNSLGELKPHPDVPDHWLISQPTPVPFFGGKLFEIAFTDYLEDDENFFAEADEIVQNFLQLDGNVKFDYTDYVYQNYIEFADVADIETLDLKDKHDIWKYVYPSHIYVKRRHRRDKDVYVDVHCECEWEIEHGLQLVFRQGLKLTKVSDIDGHLTEADAWDKPDSEDELLSKFEI